MARDIKVIQQEYADTCVKLGENHYTKAVISRKIQEGMELCDKLQKEAQAILDSEAAAKATEVPSVPASGNV